MTESTVTAQGVVEAKLLGEGWGGENLICRRKGACFVRPENVLVGPFSQRVSCVNSARFERNFVANGPTAEGRECVNAAGC